MNKKSHELDRIAAQLKLLAREGHGGSEARLVKTLADASRRLQSLAAEGRSQSPECRRRKLSPIRILVLTKLIYDLLSSLAS